MVFASLTFLYLFLPLSALLYFAWNNITYRNIVLTLVSLVFYAWGEPVWVTLLLFSSGVDWAHGLLVERFRGRWQAKAALISCLTINLGLLGAFKYGALITETLNAVLPVALPVPQVALPVGISFYTFQTISYVVDVYRGEIPAARSPLKFLLFVSLFHQLVAGPIVRYAEIAAEIDNRVHSWDGAWRGLRRIAKGLFKKVCIANVAALLVQTWLDGNLEQVGAAGAWLGLLAFAVQIYFDFSGYSDMAIGMGWMFGFHYSENFNHPYVARSATDFWRRWHISLGTFFRDYVYIPLGGSRSHGMRNLFIVWGLTGLWHGANWNFVIWGLYFGLLIAAERLFLQRLLERLPRSVGHLYLLSVIMVSWAIFYSTDLGQMRVLFSALLGGHGLGDTTGVAVALRANMFWLAAALLLCLPLTSWTLRWSDDFELAGGWRRGLAVGGGALAALLMLLAATAMLVGGTYNPFIYYRF